MGRNDHGRGNDREGRNGPRGSRNQHSGVAGALMTPIRIRTQFFAGLALISALMIASLVVSAFMVRATESSLQRLSEQALPATHAAMSVAQVSAQIAAGIPVLAAAENRYDRQAAQVALQQKVTLFRQHLGDLLATPRDSAFVDRISALADETEAEIRAINALVHRRHGLLTQLGAAGHVQGAEWIADRLTRVDADLDQRMARTRSLSLRLSSFVHREIMASRRDTRSQVASLDDQTALMAAMVWGLGAVTVLLVMPFFWIFVGLRIVRRLGELAQAARAVADGSRESRLPPASRDEMGDLRDALVLARQAMRDLAQTNARLRAREQELRHLAISDPLTGAANRRRFNEVAQAEIERARRQDLPLALLMIDLDHFKAINDRHGHTVGDTALIATTTLINAMLRGHDLLARFGGEEFVVLLPGSPLEGAAQVAERLREAIAGHSLESADGESIRWTMSIGVAILGDEHDSLDDLIRRADTALYRAKALGRNRIVPQGA